MRRRLAMVMLATGLSACGLLRSTMPDYVRENIGQDDQQDWMQGNLDHPSVWAENLHTMMLNSSVQAITHSHWALDGAIHSVRGVAAELETLEREGARFRVVTSAGGRMSLEVLKPASATDVVGEVVGRFIPFANREDLVGITLNNVGRAANQLRHDSIPTIERLLFRTVTEIRAVNGGQELSFKLPEGLTRETFAGLLDCLLVAYHNDYEEVMTYQATLASTLPAVASLDSTQHGAVANLYAVFGAALEDRARFTRLREGYRVYPKTPEALAEIRTKAAALQAALLQSARYKAWLDEPHAWNQIADFGAAAADAFGSLSEVYGAMGGVDVVGAVRDRVAEGVTVDQMLDVALRLVPQGGQLRGVIETGKKAYAGVQAAQAIAADPTAAATGAATRAVLWAADAQVERARRLVADLPSPPR